MNDESPRSPDDRPFSALERQVHRQSGLRAAITAAYRIDEPRCVRALLEAARFEPPSAHAIDVRARSLAARLRERGATIGREGLVQGLLAEFSLSSQEGVALMCLAEALLRIPDDATRDALIRDKLRSGDWRAHTGGSLFVHAAAWGLVVTGKLVSLHDETGLSNALVRAVTRSGEPLVRRAVDRAMRLLGEQFVAGETIAQAIARARRREAEGFRHSYDMLGEAALTEDDALRYLCAYENAIDAIGEAAAGRGVLEGPGVSIKLSALHPRYTRAQYARVADEAYPRLRSLALRARSWGIGLNLDAEEADRLDVSLDLLERLCFERELAGWHGIGFVAQAYQKRCLPTIDWLVELAGRSGHRLMVRLVKGAYWDSEIKRAQVDGLGGYPVFTRKAHTDVSYLACARRLLGVREAVYPQFATHNAHTVAAVYEAAGQAYFPGQYEFQCLHGMGEPLFEHVVRDEAEGGLGRPCRIYAPVGTHDTLLAYLVRRLLENGANTSFVHRIADESVSLDELVADPVRLVEDAAREEGDAGLPHPAIPLPRDLYGTRRANSRGIDLSDEDRLVGLATALSDAARRWHEAGPIVGGRERASGVATRTAEVGNPADLRDRVGRVVESTHDDVDEALRRALDAAPRWAGRARTERAAALENAAAKLEVQAPEWIALLVREAGKALPAAIAEVRESIDFLRYYASDLRERYARVAADPLGPVVCISPWNFPLAIFTGQVAASLAAGNVVLAKPAEQTPLVAARLVRLLHEAGVDPDALHLLPGPGDTVGAALVADERVRGVVFTGSTDVARAIQRSLAGRLDDRGQPIVLVAETGGINAMIVDSSALAEQSVVDIVASAFDSAGQRCSALRVLCVQHEAADRVLGMLRGAMRELRVGRPDRLDTDVGPVIDGAARDALLAYIDSRRAQGFSIVQPAADRAVPAVSSAPLDAQRDGGPGYGYFVEPTLIELSSIRELRREVFGPILHVVRYARSELPALLQAIDDIGYGLTLGVQTRIDETVEQIAAQVRVGNQYVNRNTIGAVVGVQPFGGEGLSGTGPQAGGPLYLRRLMRVPPGTPLSMPGTPLSTPGTPLSTPGVEAATASVPRRARERPGERRSLVSHALAELEAWTRAASDPQIRSVAETCAALARETPLELGRVLDGPTGERNTWWLAARVGVLGVASNDADRVFQLAHVVAAGSTILWHAGDAAARGLRAALPEPVRAFVETVDDLDASRFDRAIAHVARDELRRWSVRLAQRDGPIVTLIGCAPGERSYGAIPLELLFVERTRSVNTAAAGGNASLMTIG